MSLLTIILSILPIILIAIFFYKNDTQKESKGLLQKLFFSGFLSVCIVVIISLIIFIIIPEYVNVDINNYYKLFIHSFIIIALIEELSKWLMIYKISYNHDDFDQLYDIILYSVFVGLGFACLENILYVVTSEFAVQTAFLRAITAIPAHASFQTFMGYYLSLSKFDDINKKNKYLTLSIIIPVILHGIYDFLLLSENIVLFYCFLIFIISMFIFTILRIKKIIKSDNNKLKENTCPNCNIIIEYNFCPTCGHKK